MEWRSVGRVRPVELLYSQGEKEGGEVMDGGKFIERLPR